MAQVIPPSPIDAPFGSYGWADWYEKVRRAINEGTATIPVAQGGTGITSYTAGDTLYATGASILAKLPIGVNGRVLTVVGGLPAWSVAAAGTVTAVTGSGNIASSGGATPNITFTGNLPVANLNSGTSASNASVWRGDGVWAQGVNGPWSVAGTLTGVTSLTMSAGLTGVTTITMTGVLSIGNQGQMGDVYNAAVANGATLATPYGINGGIILVRNVSTGGVGVFIIDGAGVGTVKLGGSVNIVLGAPGAGQLGVNGTTGTVTNNTGGACAIAILSLTCQ